MAGPSDVKDREPSAFEAALARFEGEVGRRERRRVSLDEIVELIRADREAADR
jgi:hypothetical protein